MSYKGDSSKIKRGTCNVPVEASNICNVLPKSAVSNRLIVVKLKRSEIKGHVYFKSACTHSFAKYSLIWNLIINYTNIFLLESVS